MKLDDQLSHSASNSTCLVEIRDEPGGQVTAEILGVSDLRTTAQTREQALDQLRALLRQRLDSGALVSIDVSQENPLMRWFGHAKGDPDFEDYLQEIRKYREEVDQRDEHDSGLGECSNTSSTPTI
jgi:hypothetical protein